MSEMETRKGRLKKINHINGYTTMDAIIGELVEELGCVEDYQKNLNNSDDSVEAFCETCYDIGCNKYKFIGEDIYEVLEDAKLDYEGFYIIHKNDDGTMDYIAQWYNGGASLEEVLEWELTPEKNLLK